MKNTQFKGEWDNVAVTKEENDFPFPETEIALRQQELKWNAQVLFYLVQPIFTWKLKNGINFSEGKKCTYFCAYVLFQTTNITHLLFKNCSREYLHKISVFFQRADWTDHWPFWSSCILLDVFHCRWRISAARSQRPSSVVQTYVFNLIHVEQ